uniref:Uncharacterized protein n=1 Tax=Pyramimonas orientalis virus TaxID=455367 RepID=A0A7L9AYX0_POV01|nr:hypothetical protein HWQ62_00334 [Pyramimonas orientalis virus]
MKRAAVLFGLDYSHTPGVQLNGCINDVHKMEMLLKGREYNFDDIRVCTDECSDNISTTKQG